MFISHKYKFIFLRVPKTASTSLSEFFVRNIDDPDAFYTDVDDANLDGTVPHDKLKEIRGVHEHYKPFSHLHLNLKQLVDHGMVTPEQINEYYCFAVLRDPIERQKSFYYFFKKWEDERSGKKPYDIDDYKFMAPNGWFDGDKATGEDNSKLLQTDFLMYDGKQQGEYWLYENIMDHLIEFMNKLDLEIKHPLKKHKSNFRVDKIDESKSFNFDHQAITSMRHYYKNDFNLYSLLKRQYHADTTSLHTYNRQTN